jgi:hypothetical protein
VLAKFYHHTTYSDMKFTFFSVSPCSPNPCLNDGSCTVDVDAKSVCTCNGEWTGCDCSSKYGNPPPFFFECSDFG